MRRPPRPLISEGISQPVDRPPASRSFGRVLSKRPAKGRSPIGRSRIFMKLALAFIVALTARAGDAPADLHGRLTTQDGIAIVELWGSADQAGFAYGWLCASDVVELFDEFVLHPRITPSPALYESSILPAACSRFEWPDECRAELDAVFRGAVARLGEAKVYSRRLERPLRVEDLLVANSMADWFGLMCSSFSAWGPLTETGQTITARNLDFPFTPAMRKAQLVLVRRNDAPRRSWATVTWPGLIGVYTGMNDDGVTMLMHDANGLPMSAGQPFTPRSLVLREALERASATTFVDDVRTVFEKRHVMVGNNIHVSRPAGDGPNAVVFEYDANRQDQGVTLRVDDGRSAPSTNGTPLPPLAICTNHMRSRREAEPCERYERLSAELARLSRDHARLDGRAALEKLKTVTRRDTLHSVVLLPASKILLLRLPQVHDEPVEIQLGPLLRGAGAAR